MREGMIADGVGTCIGALFGSIVPTTCYIGHPRHIPAYCVGLFFVIADPWNFDMRDQGTLYCTRSIGRAQGLKNMWPGGGIMCSLMTTQVLCDLTDGAFMKGGFMSLTCVFLSLFGLMHGNNA